MRGTSTKTVVASVYERLGGSVADLDISLGGPVGPGSKKVPAPVDPGAIALRFSAFYMDLAIGSVV
jgi:hypothetical protein